nr:hypothetical protein Itr_chr04CG13850 [Ipomoea trifida]
MRPLRPVKQSSGSAMATVGSGKRSDGVFYYSLLQGCLVSEEDDVPDVPKSNRLTDNSFLDYLEPHDESRHLHFL